MEDPDKHGWWPNLSEYDPGITADQYHDLFPNEDVVKKDMTLSAV